MRQTSALAAYESVLGGDFLSPTETTNLLQTSAKPEHRQEIDNSSPAKPSWKPELKRVVEISDEEGKQEVVALEDFKHVSTELQKPKRDEEREPRDIPFASSAMLLRARVRRFSYRNGTRFATTVLWRLEIQSETLRDLFRTHATRYRELNLGANPLVIEYPFKCLFFLRSKLQELYRDPATPVETQRQLGPLLGFIEEPLGIQRHIEEYDHLVLAKGQINFRMLWSIYPPFSPVVVFDCGYLVESVTLQHGSKKKETFLPHWELKLLKGHHDGTKFRLYRMTLEIDFFAGRKDIKAGQLDALPLHLMEDGQRASVWNRLVERGKKYIQYSTADTTFLHYKGRASLDSSEVDKRLGAWDSPGTLDVDERVVLDRTAQRKTASGISDKPVNEAYKSVADCLSSSSAQGGGTDKARGEKDKKDSSLPELPPDIELMMMMEDDEYQANTILHGLGNMQIATTGTAPSGEAPAPANPAHLTDDDYFVCPNTTVAFALDQKVWLKSVRIAKLQEVAWNGDPFRSLQFTDQAKRLVDRLVRGFNNRDEDTYDDIISGKGKGLVFLLHGAPGLGKTLTAESVAESARRPLYRVTTGELSTDVKELETQLRDIFRLGARWRAVVLLDEADVLMTQRSVADLKRNAIVAVFLRLLEYYRGMLFLTTNRHDDFDEAFHSRIHVSLEYGELTPAWRANIWREHVGRATHGNKVAGLWGEDMFQALGRIQTNGREIKNYTRTAYAFAQAEDEDLMLHHVLIVLVNNLPQAKRKAHEAVLAELGALNASSRPVTAES